MIHPEIEKTALETMSRLRKQMDSILLDAGMTQEEIQQTVEKAMDGVFINGVPVGAVACSHCDGRGWLRKSRLTPSEDSKPA